MSMQFKIHFYLNINYLNLILCSLWHTGTIIKNFTVVDNSSSSPETSLLGNQNAAGVINQYKEIIRDQDNKLQHLQMTVKRSEKELDSLKKKLNELQQTNSQLNDQNILFKAQLTASTNGNSSIAQNGQNNNHHAVSSATEMDFYKSENKRLSEEVKTLNEKLNEALEMTEQSLNLTEIGRMRKDQEDLLELLTDQVNCEYFSILMICRLFLFETNSVFFFVSGKQNKKISKTFNRPGPRCDR